MKILEDDLLNWDFFLALRAACNPRDRVAKGPSTLFVVGKATVPDHVSLPFVATKKTIEEGSFVAASESFEARAKIHSHRSRRVISSETDSCYSSAAAREKARLLGRIRQAPTCVLPKSLDVVLKELTRCQARF